MTMTFFILDTEGNEMYDCPYLIVELFAFSLQQARINKSPCPVLLNHLSQLAASKHGVCFSIGQWVRTRKRSFNFTLFCNVGFMEGETIL